MIPNSQIHRDWASWAGQVQQILTPILTRLEESFFRQGRTLELASFTVAALPSATKAGKVIYVSNEAGGAVLAFSDGTNWRRVTDRAIVS